VSAGSAVIRASGERAQLRPRDQVDVSRDGRTVLCLVDELNAESVSLVALTGAALRCEPAERFSLPYSSRAFLAVYPA
jgi:hypothetical protein